MQEHSETENLSISSKLKGVLFLGKNEQDKLLAIEAQWTQITKKFPGTLLLKKYGKAH